MERCKPSIRAWFSAIEKGSLSQTQRIWKDIGDANITNTLVLNNVKHENVTPLILCAHCGHKDIVRWFLSNTDADVNAATSLGWRAIHFAAKRGHAATVDMLCNSGAVIDAVTLDNETPLLMAMQSHMRDTIRKLINLGARMDNYVEALAHQYYRGILHSDTYARARNRTESPYNGILHTDKQVSGVSNSHDKIHTCAINDGHKINQLQYQSTNYDLELTRRKREIIGRLTLIPNLLEQHADQFLALIQKVARADLNTENRISAMSQLFTSVTDACGKNNDTTVKTGVVGEPYLRLIEVCLCESHCPLELAIEFSRLAVKLNLLGVGKQGDLNGAIADDYPSDNSSGASVCLVSYILRLLKKLILKSNYQYRWGILSHLCRVLCDLRTSVQVESKDQSLFAVSWCDVTPSASTIIATLIRLGESLDQPINVARFAQLAGLIARRLILFSSKCNIDVISSRFSDLADILVGWAVDTSSLSKGINLQIIYDEMQNGLSSWFVVPSISKDSNTPSQSQLHVNENIRVMISHLLEDSENYLNNALSESQLLNQQPPDLQLGNNTTKIHCDPNLHFISVNLSLSILSSILKGISRCIKLCGNANFNDILLPDSVSHWVKRLLRIALSATSCYRTQTANKHNISRRSGHSALSLFHVPFTLIVSIESAILHLLLILLDFQCFSDLDLPAVDDYILSLITERGNCPFESESFSVLLNLIRRILELKFSSAKFSPDPDALYIYFGSFSCLHGYKTHTGSNQVTSSPSERIFTLLCSLKNIRSLYLPLFELALSDLRLSLSSISVGSSDSFTPLTSDFECLALFSLALITHLFKDIPAKVEAGLQRRLSELLEHTCLAHWISIPARLRIAILSLISDVTFYNNLRLAPSLCLANVKRLRPGHLECSAILSLVEVVLAEELVSTNDIPNLCMQLIEFANYILTNQTSMGSEASNVFTRCVNSLINLVFKSGNCLTNQRLLSELLSISRIASVYPYHSVRTAGVDLLLLIESYSTSNIMLPAARFYSEFNWFTSRRPDNSATSLLSPLVNDSKEMSTSGLTTSVSAFPSLPAIVGVLGIVTRGSPYESSSRSSRLKILKHPDDWMRRLSCLISPLPSDYKCHFHILQCTSYMSCVLWYAAWAMVDFKLKVAPWANPLKTFLALEGALRAFIQPPLPDDNSTNKSQITPFHLASSEAQSRQTTTEQLYQMHLLFGFLGYIERIIFNAIHGFAVALPRPMMHVCNFFLANENTCTQWFKRFQSQIINLAGDLPTFHSGNCVPNDEATATLIHHAYCLLRNVMHLKTQSDGESWQAYLRPYGGSSNILINVCKALHRLGAWEELQALAEWTDHLFTSEHNAYSWIHGISALANNRWDSALRILTDYLDNLIALNVTKTIVKSKVDAPKEPFCTSSAGYVAGVLLQMHLSEGNYNVGSDLCSRVTTFLNDSQADPSSKQHNYLFTLNSFRLHSFRRLSGWSSKSDDKCALESSKSCFYHPLRKALDILLESAADTLIYSHDKNVDNMPLDHLSKLTSIVRQTAVAVTLLTPVNSVINAKSCFGLAREDKLQDWVLRCDMMLNRNSFYPARTVDLLEYSTWSHLISANDRNSHVDSEIIACQLACSNYNTELARRLVVRTAECLSLDRSDTLTGKFCTDYFDELCHVASFGKQSFSKVTPTQTLRLYDSLARILWYSDNRLQGKKLDNRLRALLILTNGLKIILVDENQLDAGNHVVQCQLLGEMALRLFDWLESSVDGCEESWAEHIFNKSKVNSILDQLSNSICSNLNFFTRLADEPWVNGLPILTPHILNPTDEPQSTSCAASPTLWTNRLLMMATHLSPTGSSAIAWLKMANWCYARGIKEVTEIQTAAHMHISGCKDGSANDASLVLKLLRPNEYDLLASILKLCVQPNTDTAECTDTNPKDKISNLICSLIVFSSKTFEMSDNDIKSNEDRVEMKEKICVNQHLSPVCCDDAIDEETEQNLRSHLIKTFPAFGSNVDAGSVQSLHTLLVSLYERLYTLHTSSAQAFATFLTIADQQFCNNVFSGKSFTKLDTTSATLKLLDLLGMPSRKLRKLISGFLDYASPILPESRSSHTSIVSNKEHTMDTDFNKLDYLEKMKIGPTLGGPAVWEACFSQLLVRLTAPDPMIRDCLVVLLGRLMMRTNGQSDEHFKWSSFRLASRLIFPAVVAVSSLPDIRSDAIYQKNCGVFATTNVQPCSFARIINTLEHAGFTDLVRKVETFTAELQRITLLWEELWYGSLVNHLDELSKKMTHLESEVKRSMKNHSLNPYCKPIINHKLDLSANEKVGTDSESAFGASEMQSVITDTLMLNEGAPIHTTNEMLENIIMTKYISAIQPTLDLFAQLRSLTLDVKPETSHEEWFQRTVAPTIRDIHESLLHPVDPKDSKQPILLIRQLIHHLQTAYQPNNSVGVTPNVAKVNALVMDTKVSSGNTTYLSLNQLSPKLVDMQFGYTSNLQNDRHSFVHGIPLPGHFNIKASHLANRVAILFTKTRPKRLLFRAQNGRSYSYLLKGLEDLRLDDRIMHLFELTNLAFAQLSNASRDQMHTRTYSVTPLGVRSGLLQMVQGALPLFSLYKRWQIRSYKGTTENSTTSVNIIPRPVELFHNRLKKLMTANGQQYQPHSRASWSLDVLKDVFTSLESDTPPDLLTRELWASNASCASWWQTSQTFARSAGLMSSLGYLVGLGDRHLDNLLIDLSTGHIIHIDYNVCFDKGRSLRVAERVPFRLTRILRHPLGPAAQDNLVQGTFRISAEKVLQVVRDIADPFLIHLKAFIIDPLVDWQQKRQHSLLQPTVTDFTHLSTFYGGGSTTSHQHQITSVLRRSRRVDSEIRLYTGLVTTRLLELNTSDCLALVYSNLDSVTSHLSVWAEWIKAKEHSCLLNERYSILTNVSQEDLSLSQRHCRELDLSADALEKLRLDLIHYIEKWHTDLLAHLTAIQQSNVPCWLSTMIFTNQLADDALKVALSEYFSVSRIYINSLKFPMIVCHEIQHLQQLFTTLKSYLSLNEINIDGFIKHLSTFEMPSLDKSTENLLPTLLPAVEESRVHLDNLCCNRTVDTDPSISTNVDYGVIISNLHEINNVKLFVHDQGNYGARAYCWALMDHILNITLDNLALETDPKDWQGSNEYEPSKSSYLGRMHMNMEILYNLFNVLNHFSTYMFSAGYEADVCREMNFLSAVRDATLCITQLHSNLTRLLLPKAVDALPYATPNAVEKFSTFVVHHLTKTEAGNLKQLVDEYLFTHFIADQPGDSRLHQVLIAAHLALTNATAQMEEIALRVRSYGITAPAWYYVDIISQSANVLMSRSTNWQSGATSLWGWEISPPFSDDSQLRCSWADEIYTSGLTAFVSVLDDGIAHWSTVRQDTTNSSIDLVLKPFTNAINCFIGRLTSRIALASLISFTASRLFCALVEDSGVNIRRLVIENEMDAKANAILTTCDLAAEKMITSVDLRYSLTQPAVVQHLQAPASNLIKHLITRSTRISQQICETMEIETAEYHHEHLNSTLTVFNWIYHPGSLSDDAQTGLDIGVTLHALKKAIDDGLDVQSEKSSSVSHNNLALSLWYFEKMRTNGLSDLPGYTKCLDLATQLKQVINEKDNLTSKLSDLDKMLITVRHDYQIKEQLCDSVSDTSYTNADIMERLKLDTINASAALDKLATQLASVRRELQKMSVEASVHGETSFVHSASKYSKRINRYTHGHGGANPTCPPAGTSDSPTVGAKPVVLSSILSSIEKLQHEWLSEICHLIKLLSRCETLRSNLLHEFNHVHNYGDDSKYGLVWTGWLDNHQKWTFFVNAILKKLSTFIDFISSQKSKPTLAADELANEEAGMASSLHKEFLKISDHLKNRITLPLLTAIRVSARTDTHLADLVNKLLVLMCSKFNIGVDLELCQAADTDCISSFVSKALKQYQPSSNVYALSVWQRIYDRLHGFDPFLTSNDGPGVAGSELVPLSISAQVDACIQQATNIDNLALMYEGWTAWV